MSFVNAVEAKKNFSRDHNLVFRHLVSELGELDARIWQYEKNTKAGINGSVLTYDAKYIGYELVDIVFLACFLAEIFGVDLDDLIGERIEQIKNQYGVEWP